MLRGPEGSGDNSARLGFLTSEAGSSYAPYISITYAGMTASEELVPAAEGTSEPLACGPTVKEVLDVSPNPFNFPGFGFTELAACSSD
jgi:hypothetical protein